MLSLWEKKENLAIFSVLCQYLFLPFCHAQTVAHNQVYKTLAASLPKDLVARWSLCHGTQLSQTLLSQGGKSQIQTLHHYTGVLEGGNLILWQFPTPIRKLQRCAHRLIHTLSETLLKAYGGFKAYGGLQVESCRHTKLFQ